MAESVLKSLAFLLSGSGDEFVELKESTNLRIDLRYATENNFVGKNMYGSFNRAFLHRIAGEKLERCRAWLRREFPDYSFIVYDALRPRSIQRILWQHVVGTDGERYIANPDNGSLHNFGFAIDLSILDNRGKEIDMGAGYDDFRLIAQPQLEARFLRDGQLTRTQVSNRDILRAAMKAGDFTQLPHEWWHFDALSRTEARKNYKIVE